jgi:hypothetical protein
MAPIIPRDSVPPLEVKNSTCFESFNSIPLLRDEEDGSDESDVDEGVDSGDFDEFARLWNIQGCDGVTIFKKTPYHLQRYWKMSTRDLEIKSAKRTRIQNGGSRILARELILSSYSEIERFCCDPPETVEETEMETTAGSRTYTSCGTNTSPEKQKMHALVNLDTMVGASGQLPQQNPTRKKRKCKTCSSTICQGLNSRSQDKCLGINNEV